LTQTGGTVNTTTIYTRLEAGLSTGDYNSEDITASSTGATSKTVTCSGSVTSTQVTESFDGLTEGSYGDYTYNGFYISNGLCNSTNARSGNAVRLRDATTYMQYQGTDGNGKDGGVGDITFWYRSWDADPAAVYDVKVNINGGGWQTIGSQINTTSTTYAQWSHSLNNANDNIIIKIERSSGERLHIDDFSITSFKDEPTNHVTDFAAGTTTPLSIPLSWTENDGAVAPDGYLIKASTGTVSNPVDGIDPSDDTNLTDGSGNIKVLHGNASYTFSNCSSSTQYYFKIFPYSNSGTNIDFKTDGTPPSADATTEPNIIISEVADPSDFPTINVRFVELYNLGSTAIDLSSDTWYISRQANGDAWNDAALTGTIAPKGTYVISYNSASFTTAYGFNSDQNAEAVVTGNGNDGYYLYRGGDHSSGTLIDAYGVIGQSSGDWIYTDSKAVRKNTVTEPNASWTSGEWTIASATTAECTPGEYDDNVSWNGGTGNWSSGGSWSNGNAPATGASVHIPSGAVLSVDEAVTVANLSVQDGGSFNVNLSQTLSVSSTITIEDGGSFINNGTLDNGAKADASGVMQRTIDGYTLSTNGWHLIASPVNNFAIDASDFDPGVNDDLFAWDEVGFQWLNHKVGINNITNFTNGKGYLVSYETTATKDFSGTFNNSDVTFSNLSKTTGEGEGWHLLGNPFQSALHWNNTDWSMIAIATGAKIMNSGGSYTDITFDGANQYIPANQGFFIQVSNATNSITIPIAVRAHNSTAFYKNSIPNLLTLKAEEGNFYQETWIQFIESSTENFDENYDVRFLSSMFNAPKLYSIAGEEDLSTNRIPKPDNENIISLGFKSQTETYINIHTIGVESFAENIKILLEDIQESTIVNLRENPVYSFESKPEYNTERFRIHFKSITGIDETGNKNIFDIYSFNSNIYIINPIFAVADVVVYNIMGQEIENMKLDGDEFNSFYLDVRQGYYIVKVISDQFISTEKVYLK